MEQTRPPVVTILGHVDHGKTTLLDFIRKSNVVAKEHGGITQHIGAYQVQSGGKTITFIDTPGHAAFEKMRSRGAQVADIAVLVVAINDGVMAQTVEAINHIKKSSCAMVVAVTKIDLPGVDVKVQLEKIKKQLSDREVLIEEYSGEVPLIPLSAKTGEGVDKLLEVILLVAEINELKGDAERVVEGVVIESSLDKSKGPVATILVRDGSLKKGQQIVVGGVKGKIRGMFDSAGKSIEDAGPSTPVEVLGLEGIPAVGSLTGQQTTKEEIKAQAATLAERLKQGQNKSLKLVLRADKQGSLEAVTDMLERLNKDEKMLEILSAGIGDITESDLNLASASKAIVVGFNVKAGPQIDKLAEREKILVRTYNIIYELVEELEEVVESMVKPGHLEEMLGRAEVLASFPHSKTENIAGCRVLEGGFSKNSKVRVIRDDTVVGEGKVSSLRKAKEEVIRVEKGADCGILFEPVIDFAVGDFVEAFRVI